MSNPNRLIRRCKAVLGAAALALAGVAAVPTAAHADAPHHYYIEIGGTGSAADAPNCTTTFGFANQHLNGGIPVPVCYVASGGPFVGSHNEMPAPFAPSFADSVNQGYRNTLDVLEKTYHADPTAQFTIVGYSQGAWIGDDVLQTIANNGTDVPRSQVNGMLYSDPMQPGTGFWHLLPQGVPLPLVAVSPGTGPVEFPGVPVQRFCIHSDGVCDATSLDSFGGLLQQHPRYWQDNNIMTQTIGNPGGDGIVWLPAA
ncbi:PE-PPE domain-containing protein [Saccharothrix sp. ST-888]|uniref:PE-PPE domain-containing protein n=1 Tax=Saccharothrix sp. ST-888 TaxID=1427391 RepID=UPI0005ED03FE|nr:PE-PPE domain-containing protein [Saccharothrix sp. ST-888]KJK56579.1 PE-PPE domain-containing protein [Saccharothrix sp. ST-888]